MHLFQWDANEINHIYIIGALDENKFMAETGIKYKPGAMHTPIYIHLKVRGITRAGPNKFMSSMLHANWELRRGLN